jgi:bifunctional DNA-binding transcriptional regulator/antitoxin component of YhaV-PrlF toxin-antitoxin module
LAVGHHNQPIRIASNGRLSFPANQRKALGQEQGGMVVSTVEKRDLRLRTAQAVMKDPH